MTIAEAMSDLKAAVRNDGGAVLEAQEIKRCACQVAEAADHEATLRAMRQMDFEQQQDAVFCAVLQRIAQPC